MKMMKAVRVHEYGGVEVLRYEDAPRPTINNNELLIRVHGTTVNPLDWKLRSGIYLFSEEQSFPVTLGFDVAGVVEEVGTDVKAFTKVDAVYGFTGGCYAEYVVMVAESLAHKPRTLDYIQAAAIPASGITAWQTLFEFGQLQAGQRLLIHGAAGGVGSFAVQMARWRGAQVIGTASKHNLDFLKELGADEVIDYNTTRFEDVVRNVDFVFDTIGGETMQRSAQVVKPGGKLITIADNPPPEMAAQYGIDARLVDLEWPFTACLTEIARLVDDGHIKPIVSTVLPLQEIQQAHRLSESRHVRGKIVLQV